MNWTQYQKMLEIKIADTHYNLRYTEKKYREAKAAYDASLKELEAFEIAVEGMVEKIDKL